MLEAGFQQLVVANARVQAIIGNPARFYPVLVPDEPIYPCASFQVISDTPVDLLDGSLAICSKRIQVDTWSGGSTNANYADVKNAQEAIRVVLESFTGLLPDGTRVAYIHVVNARDLYEQDARSYRTSTDFMVYYYPAAG
jgi:hypothetical protein